MFSKTTEYALRATIYIALRGSEENKLSIDEISKAIDSPRPFTAKILQLLTKDNKVVSSVKGPGGGFYITSKSKKLPAKNILDAVHDDKILTKCVLGLHQCSEKNPCPMHSDFKKIRSELNHLFERRTIAYFAEKMNMDKIFINNSK